MISKIKTFIIEYIAKPIGWCFVAFFALGGRPWVWFGRMPMKDETERLPLPKRVHLVPAFAFPTALIGLNILFVHVLMPKSITDHWWANLLSGMFCALLVTSLNDDFFTPWWRRRFMRRIQARTTLELPDRSLDTVIAYKPGETMRLSKECRIWAKQNLKGKVGLVPMNALDFHKREAQPKVWFTDPDDAFAFKLRWL